MKAFILLALFMFGLAFGQQHIDTTAVTLGELINENGEHFLVSIDHIEDEIDINGVLLAERGVHVGLQFDVNEKQEVIVNGVPAVMGYNELKIAAVLYEIDAEGQPSPFDQIVSISIRIFVGTRMVTLDDGSTVTGVYIQERVVGIQEKEVWQASVKEQVLIVRADGSIYKFETVEVAELQGEIAQDAQVDPAVGEKPHHGHGHGHGHGHSHEMQEPQYGQETPVDDIAEQPVQHNPHGKCQLTKYWHKFLNWFHNLPFYLRLLVSFAGGLILGFVGIAILKCLCYVCCGKKCKKNCKEENFKKNIHLYSLQYTALPQDEKQAEKKAAVESV